MLRISDLGSIPVSVRAMAENKLPMKQSRLCHTLSIWKCGLTWQAALVDGEQLCNHFAPLQKNDDPHFHMAIRGQKLELDDISQKYPLKGKLTYLLTIWELVAVLLPAFSRPERNGTLLSSCGSVWSFAHVSLIRLQISLFSTSRSHKQIRLTDAYENCSRQGHCTVRCLWKRSAAGVFDGSLKLSGEQCSESSRGITGNHQEMGV